MPRCTRKGCLKEFDEESNEEGSCSYHPGGPVSFLPPSHLLRGRQADIVTGFP